MSRRLEQGSTIVLPKIILEQEKEDEERRLEAAFEMLIPDGVQPINNPQSPVEPKTRNPAAVVLTGELLECSI